MCLILCRILASLSFFKSLAELNSLKICCSGLSFLKVHYACGRLLEFYRMTRGWAVGDTIDETKNETEWNQHTWSIIDKQSFENYHRVLAIFLAASPLPFRHRAKKCWPLLMLSMRHENKANCVEADDGRELNISLLLNTWNNYSILPLALSQEIREDMKTTEPFIMDWWKCI